MRMSAPDRVEPSFVQDMLAATRFKGDEAYFRRLAQDAPATVAWISSHGTRFIQPPDYLAKGRPKRRPLGPRPATSASLALVVDVIELPRRGRTVVLNLRVGLGAFTRTHV